VRLTDLSYDDWLEHAFGREVRIQQAAWSFDRDCDRWDPEPAVAVAYLTRLFESPEPSLCWYSDRQIAQGLTYLISTSASGDNGWLYSTDVAIADRVNNMSRDSQGRFRKGFCGNPLGRPRKTKRTLYNIKHEDEFIAATEEEFPVTIAGKPEKCPAIELILKQLVRKAAGGDIRCMLKVLELRESYARRHADQQSALCKTYLDASQRFQRNPEDHTDDFREALEAAGSQLNRSC
jgi:Family of unknown function (DUF5681)